MIKAVLFDLDGTLIDTNELIIQSFNYTLKKHLNLEVDRNELVMHFGEPLLNTLEYFDKDNAHVLMQTYRGYNEAIHDEVAKEIVGAKETLNELKALGVKVGIVTSKRRTLAERGLNLFNLLHKMDVIITPEDTTKHKPDGEPVIKACENLGILPEEALMVGDSHNDILSGKNAGAKTCLVKYTVLPLHKIMEHNPDYAVEKIEDIIKIVREVNFR
ncbi:pyrophosphatase PpaX [Clostridium sp. SYSU_GA19001]|uniref:pyrophosphatase PpaX n=1 Tax=Clostridium caldaquaticum TaxID=2940653 RepID=UPI0020778A1B|nr:pyrophosphatase PpaX [Clostridium caldaquaticum]MCM8710888.1 pyrophosphatase PpaX [Clostridium caldaquaticum]